MIFICVGSREYQFDRLIKEVDELIENKIIKQDVFAQIGQSNYIPKHFKYKRFISSEEFYNYQSEAALIISHGGTGALVGSLKLEKQVLAVPRLAEFKEHIDDHQVQVASVLEQEGYLRCVLDMRDLKDTIIKSFENPIKKRFDKPSQVINIIDEFIRSS